MNAMTSPNLSTSTPLPATWVEKLLHEMLLTYGKKFTDQWAATSPDDLVAYWGDQLAGYSGAEIRRGLDAMASKDWPPTLPEFKRLCRPGVDPLKAYYEAVAGVQARVNGEHGEWSHPAIYWAAMPIAVELREQSFSQVKARWENSLQQQLAKATWDEIPRPHLQLTAPGKATTSSAAAKQAIENLVRNVVHKPASTDSKAWARKLLARADAGEMLTPTQVQMARDALAMPDEPLARFSALRQSGFELQH